ncbi:MAG: restriction endonuclease subunit S [Actinobacteria bacterium]|nr:restriction endonuclease subunit S [Actinomycetota bacterium]
MTETRQIRLGRLFERRKILGFVDEPMLSVFREHGVVLKDDMVNHNQTAEDRSIYQLVEPGWLAVNRMKAWQGSLGVSAHRGIMSGHYICFAPRHSEHDRYLHYLLRSPRMTAHFAAISRGVRPGQIEIDNDQLAATPLDLPSTDEQRRIADFLDDRVARIDQIIAARGIQLDLINEVAVSGTSDLLGAVGPEGPPLSGVCRIVDTEHKTAPIVAGGGYWIAGTGAIRDGRLVHDRLRETDSDSFTEWTSRGVPECGDVLLTREAPVGEVALLSEHDPPVAIGQRVVLLKPNAKTLDSGFLRLVLMAGEMRRIISMASAGSLHPHLNMADISRLRIPSSPLEDQLSLGRAHQRILMHAQSSRSTLERSLDRLIEYKQSLITAAVTGEFDVTTTGSGIPG